MQKLDTAPLMLIITFGMLFAMAPIAIDFSLPALPAIAKTFASNSSEIKLTISIFTFGFAVGQLFWGPLSDSFGRKSTLIISCVLFAIASLLCTFSQSERQLILARLLQGIFSAATGVVVMAALRDQFNQTSFSRIVSLVTLAMTIAPLVAPIFGGYVFIWFGWRANYFFSFIYVFLGLSFLMLFFSESLSTERRIPFSPKTVIRNYVRLLKRPDFILYFLCNGFSFAGLFVFITASSFVYQEFFHVKAENYGYYFAANVAALMFMTLFNATLVARLGVARMLKLGLFIQLSGGVVLLVAALFYPVLWFASIGVMLYCSVLSVVGSNLSATVLYLSQRNAGSMGALVTFFRFITGSIVAILVGLFETNRPEPMFVTFFVCAVLSLLTYYWARAYSSKMSEAI